LFDFAHVLDCDYSATNTFRDVLDLLTDSNIEIFASAMNDNVGATAIATAASASAPTLSGHVAALLMYMKAKNKYLPDCVAAMTLSPSPRKSSLAPVCNPPSIICRRQGTIHSFHFRYH